MRNRQRRKRDYFLKWLVTAYFVTTCLIWFFGGLYILFFGDYSWESRLRTFGIASLLSLMYVVAGVLWFKFIYPGTNRLFDLAFNKLDQLVEKAPNFSWRERLEMIVGGLLGFSISLTLLINNIMALQGNGFLFDNFDTLILVLSMIISVGVGVLTLFILFLGMSPNESSTQRS